MPMTREQALIRREEMMIDTAWRDKFMAGDADARREMHAVSVAIAGNDGPPPGWNFAMSSLFQGPLFEVVVGSISPVHSSRSPCHTIRSVWQSRIRRSRSGSSAPRSARSMRGGRSARSSR